MKAQKILFLSTLIVFSRLFIPGCVHEASATQIELNSASAEVQLEEDAKKFCIITYNQSCSGSVCPMCTQNCLQAASRWHKDYLSDIKSGDFSLPPAANLRIEGLKILGDYAQRLCKMYTNTRPRGFEVDNCESRILLALEKDAYKHFVSIPENEGDVCAQLPSEMSGTDP